MVFFVASYLQGIPEIHHRAVSSYMCATIKTVLGAHAQWVDGDERRMQYLEVLMENFPLGEEALKQIFPSGTCIAHLHVVIHWANLKGACNNIRVDMHRLRARKHTWPVPELVDWTILIKFLKILYCMIVGNFAEPKFCSWGIRSVAKMFTFANA